MADVVALKVALPTRIVTGLIGGDALANQDFKEDWAAYELLCRALKDSSQPHQNIVVLEGEASQLRHIADYLETLSEPIFGGAPKDRFGFTRAEALEAAELMLFQLAE